MELTQTDNDRRKSIQAIIWFFLYCLVIAAAVFFVFHFRVVPWPFRGAQTPAASYARVLIYLPFMVFSLASLLFLKMAGANVWENFRWKQFSASFLVAGLISIGYCLYLFQSNKYDLKGAAFVPPVVILSVLNAVSEEILFRWVLFQLLIRATGSTPLSNAVQALVYGLPHFFIAGPLFSAYAIIYGLVLGWVAKTNESIIPAIICHFIIDIGAIGLPLLIMI